MEGAHARGAAQMIEAGHHRWLSDTAVRHGGGGVALGQRKEAGIDRIAIQDWRSDLSHDHPGTLGMAPDYRTTSP